MSEAKLKVYLDGLEERLAYTFSGNGSPYNNKASNPLLDAARHACLQQKAKRIRPRMIFLCGLLLEAPQEDLLSVATATELFHTASLLHDDIIDDAGERRGEPTVNAKWSHTMAVLAGDLMFSQGFIHLKHAPSQVTTAAAQAIVSMVQGAIDEAEVRGTYDLSIDQWRHIAERKTGALFAFSGLSVGHLVGDIDAVGRLRTFGSRVGIAFQIADDLLDLIGDVKGRNRFADIRNRDVAIPILIAASSSRAFAGMLKKLWCSAECNEVQVQMVAQALLSTGAVEIGMRYIRNEVEQAILSLGKFVDSSDWRDLVSWVHNIEIQTQKYLLNHGFAV